MATPAAFWKPQTNQTVQCLLCPHTCTIPQGKRGRCTVRQNQHGTLIPLTYARGSAIALDPIEKKPLYHFHPGTTILSLGSIGCNLSCLHCQNYHISTATTTHYQLQDLSPQDAVDQARHSGSIGIAWTYNEPTIWHEYVLDTARLAKQAGLTTVSVSNGYINPDPLKQLAPHLDAMNIDVKAFTDTFYQHVCKAHLAPVLTTCEQAHALGIHLEITYLIIPGYNDTPEELQAFSHWVVDKVSPSTPIHFSRFHPDHRLTDASATPVATMLKARVIALDAGLQYVYLGNIAHGDYDNTYCPTCHALLIERQGFSAQIHGLQEGRCTVCKTAIPIVTNHI